MPHRRKVVLLIFAAILLTLALFLCRDTTSLDAKYRAWVHTKDWAGHLSDAQFNWPESIVSLVRLSELEDKYSAKAREQEEALYRSGYLAHVPVVLTNGFTEAHAIMDQLRKTFPSDADGAYLQLVMNGFGTQSEIDTNKIVIVCRSNVAAFCRQVLNITNVAILSDK